MKPDRSGQAFILVAAAIALIGYWFDTPKDDVFGYMKIIGFVFLVGGGVAGWARESPNPDSIDRQWQRKWDEVVAGAEEPAPTKKVIP